MRLLVASVFVLLLSCLNPVAAAEREPSDLSASAVECQAAVAVDDSTGTGQRGCCSWHSGVCGCLGTRVVCCDNTLSPSCTCKGGTPTAHVDLDSERVER